MVYVKNIMLGLLAHVLVRLMNILKKYIHMKNLIDDLGTCNDMMNL